MKYLHLSIWSPRKSFGGYETIIRTTASYQAKLGHHVFVVGRVVGDERQIIRTNVNGVTYYEAMDVYQRSPSTLQVGIGGFIKLLAELTYSWLRLTPLVLDVMKKEGVSTVIFYGIFLFPISPVLRLFGGKTFLGLEVIQKNPYSSPLSILYWFRRIKYKCFNGIFTYTRFFHSHTGTYDNIAVLRSYAGSTPIEYIPWGIDVASTTTIDSGTAMLKVKPTSFKYIVICPRRMVEEKGVRYLMEAIPLVLRKLPRTRFVFAGDGVLRPQLEKRAQQLGVTDHVMFTGFLDHQRTLRAIKGADAVVVPSSDEESFGMVFLEAYALKVPIVTTRFGGIPNVVEGGKTGIVVPPKDSRALARAIIQILTQKNLAREYVSNGYERLIKNFQLRQTLAKVDSFIIRLNG